MSLAKPCFQTHAHAKLNLVLRVGPAVDAPGTKTHGYHPICSYMHAIELYDDVEIQLQSSTDQTIFDIAWLRDDGIAQIVDWPIQQDLVYRAHQAMEVAAGEPLVCSIRVHKRIPAGGGLGGGSSDAASVIIGLNEVFELGFENHQVQTIAAGLGSDIAYFIDDQVSRGVSSPRPGIVSGFGETIERLKTQHAGQEVALVLPGFGCDTKAVYQAFDRGSVEMLDPGGVRAITMRPEIDQQLLRNDLADPACVVQPALSEVFARLSRSFPGRVHITGSGSTMFILGPLPKGQIEEVVPECRVVRTRLADPTVH